MHLDAGTRQQPPTVHNVMDFVQLREKDSRYIRLTCPEKADDQFIEALAHTLEPYRDGGCKIRIAYENDQARCELDFAEDWAIEPTDECLERLQEIVDQVEVVYP